MARKFRKPPKPPGKASERSWALVGIDTSVTSIAGACLMYDAVLDKIRGPGIFSVRWTRDINFLERLGEAVDARNFIWTLMSETAPVTLEPHRVFIAVEEPWPAGIVKKAESGWLRQQAQLQGSLMGGLRRGGWSNIYEVNAQVWKNVIRQETGIGRPDKWDVKAWAIEAYGLPDLPDLIDTARGLQPKPETSKAKPRQPNDVYDAAGLLAWMEEELRSTGIID